MTVTSQQRERFEAVWYDWLAKESFRIPTIDETEAAFEGWLCNLSQPAVAPIIDGEMSAAELLSRNMYPVLWDKIDANTADDDWNGGTALNAHDSLIAMAQELVDLIIAKSQPAVADDPDEAYELGKREGYESAIQDVDIATGGDGEFKGSTFPGETVDMPVMKQRIIDRCITNQPAVAGAVEEEMEQEMYIAWVISTGGSRDTGEYLWRNNGVSVQAWNHRATIRTASPSQPAAEDCPACNGRGYRPGGVISDAAGGQMDVIEDEACKQCGGSGCRASPADDGDNRDLALLKAGFMSCVDMGPPTKVKSYDGTHTTTWTWEEPDYPTVLAAFRQQDKQS